MITPEEHEHIRTGLKVLDNVSAMVAYWDKNLVCRFANRSYQDWFGIGQGKMINKITLPELLGPFYESNLPYISAVLNGEPQIFEREIITQNASNRWSIISYYPDTENGVVNGFYVHVADVTPVKELEKKSRTSNDIVNQQNKRLLNFSNIVSHNLRSYASNFELIIGFFENASTESEREEMLQYLKAISGGFKNTVAHLNEIAAVENLELKNHTISLSEYLEKSLNVLKIEIKLSDALIVNHLSPHAMANAYPAYLESIILNLLTNAIKYKHPERQARVEINSRTADGHEILTIKDNGIGIDLEKHGKDIFGIYKTFNGNSDAKGIGLYLAQLQAETMGGFISVASKIHEGSTFSVHLPLPKTEL